MASQYAITTTFTPTATCTQSQWTMLAAHSYFVYLNYPDPVPSSTFTQCYPSPFISSYFDQQAAITPLPAIAPLICPAGYQSVSVADQPDGYLACCPSGMGLHTSANAPFSRPGFNGTCYLDISTILVTAYGTDSVTATSTWSAPTGAQAYALPIEGYVFPEATNVASSSTASSTSTASASANSASASPASSAAAASATTTSESYASRHKGAIAGGTVGGVGGAALLAGLAFFLLRRRNQKKPPGTSALPEAPPSEAPPSEARWRAYKAPVEIGTDELNEKDASDVPAAELSGDTARSELETPMAPAAK